VFLPLAHDAAVDVADDLEEFLVVVVGTVKNEALVLVVEVFFDAPATMEKYPVLAPR
jgi:hypothetical protein